MVKINDYVTKIKKYTTIETHFNYAQCGVEVLSMSKRIMNEVICLAEDNNLNIYYQDTDSMHIEEQDVNKLSEAFQKKYERPLIGKLMGMFCCDFSSKIIKKDIHAIQSIFLGKKAYLDVLAGYDSDGNLVNDLHIRMKGVSSDSILHKANPNHFLNHTETIAKVIEIYEQLYDNKEVVFDLCCSGKKCSFEFTNTMLIRSRSLFERAVCFDEGEIRKSRIKLKNQIKRMKNK